MIDAKRFDIYAGSREDFAQDRGISPSSRGSSGHTGASERCPAQPTLTGQFDGRVLWDSFRSAHSWPAMFPQAVPPLRPIVAADELLKCAMRSTGSRRLVA